MSYTIDYEHVAPENKAARAKQDCIDFLGDAAVYTKTIALLNEGYLQGESRERLLRVIDIVIGISGYPAHVMVDEAISYVPQEC